MPQSNETLLGFPEEASGKKSFNKRTKQTKTFSKAVKKDLSTQFTASSAGKPLLYENDEGSISAWNAGSTEMDLHRPVTKLVADGTDIDPQSPEALKLYNAAKTVIIEL